MTPPITTHQELVLVERASALARAEKSRRMRDQEDNHVAHIQGKADRQVGLDSLRERVGGMLVGLGNAVAGRERPVSRDGRARIAPAHR